MDDLTEPRVDIIEEPHKPATILLVDDKKNVVRSLRIVLQEEDGYSVETAGSGNEAFHKIGSGQVMPDVILTDIKMSDGTGLDLLTDINKNNPELSGRVIFMTASIEGDALRNLAEEKVGKERVLEKPFDINKLRALIKEMLSGRETAK